MRDEQVVDNYTFGVVAGDCSGRNEEPVERGYIYTKHDATFSTRLKESKYNEIDEKKGNINSERERERIGREREPKGTRERTRVVDGHPINGP